MRSILATLMAGFVLAGAGVAAGQEKTDPKQIVIGIAIIATNAEYVIFDVNGEAWEDSYFEEEGRTLVLEAVDRTKEYLVKLSPADDSLKPEEVRIKPKDWKLARLDRETRQWQTTKKVKFKAWKPGEKEKVDAEKRDAEKRDAEKRDAEKKDAEKKDAEKKDAEKKDASR